MKTTGIRLFCSSLVISSILLSGCAKKPDMTPDDPYENYNRVVFAFNQDVDHLLIRTVAKVYETITPTPLQQGVTNFLDNVSELTTLPNDLLQGNFHYITLDIGRFMINSTFGVGGLFDVASRMGLPTHVETFGLTFAKWRGGKTAPYFMVPVIGPKTVQNAFGLVAGLSTSPWTYVNDDAISYGAFGLSFIETRTELLPADKMVETAFNPYIFVRDAYMQKDREAIATNQALPARPTHNS